MLLICIRIWLLVYRMNEEKVKLLSIYLEIEESVIQKVLERNSAFKLMLKYNKAIEEQDDNEDDLHNNSEEERTAKKRIKLIHRIHYFWFFLVWVICVWVSTLSTSFSKPSISRSSTLTSISCSSTAKPVSLMRTPSTPTTTLRSPISPASRGPPLTTFSRKRIVTIYSYQMRFRESLLVSLNRKLYSSSYENFFMNLWINDSCTYMSYPGCATDFFGIVKEGVDQFWSFFVRKLDILATELTTQTYPYPAAIPTASEAC